jgi:hypothetical protein
MVYKIMFGNSAAVPPKRKGGPYVTRQKQTLAGLRRSAAAEQTRFERLVKRALKDLTVGLAASQARISRLEAANKRQSAQRSRLRQEVRGLHSKQGKLRKRLAKQPRHRGSGKRRRHVDFRIKPAQTSHLHEVWMKCRHDDRALEREGLRLAKRYGLVYELQVKRAFQRFSLALTRAKAKMR